MANHKSAIKRIRANNAKKETNRLQHKTARNAIKKLRSATDKKEAEKMIADVFAMIDKLAKKHVIHKNKAANLKSSIHRHVNAIGKK